MKQCDIIIPVYKSPEWVSLCVYSIYRNTKDSLIGTIYLINDCDDEATNNCLKNLQDKYGKKIHIIKNEKNLGFVGSTNKGMALSKSDYLLLLNTDCILSNNAIEKMITNMNTDKSIGLICPISSNAANLTYEMLPGFSYSQMNTLFEKKFKGMMFDACTVVGNCLLISKKCKETVGLLNTDYGTGYGEETDYQFSAMSKGFKAKVCIDTYVFHKAEVSFGQSPEKMEKLRKNRELFFSRWGKEYNSEMRKYSKKDPINYINDNLTDEDMIPNIDTAIYLNGIVQNAGGVHVVVDLVNYLAINNFSANVIYDIYGSYKEIMLFNPLPSNELEKVKIKKLVATIWSSVFNAKGIAEKKKAKLLYFVQGYETLFENGGAYGIVETSYKVVDSIFTISTYLQKQIKDSCGVDSTIISNGINYDLLHRDRTGKRKKIKTITMVMRNNVMKGDWILIDIIRKIDLKYHDLDINVVYMNEYIEFPQMFNNNKINKYLGPLSRQEIISILSKSDVYIDASLNEGFGLTPLEAMATGNIPIVSNSFGIQDYIVDGKTGFIVNEVNNPEKYIEKLDIIMKDNKKFNEMLDNSLISTKNFDYHDSVDKVITYFKKPILTKNKLTEYDKFIVNAMTRSTKTTINNKRRLYYISKIIPKGLKRKVKKIITFLYNCYQH